MYYHPASPIGQAFASLPQLAGASNIAVVGLGVGSLSSYSHEGQRWTFYEIDPAVERIARSKYFTHLETCGPRCQVVIGDARLALARATQERYDLIVLDAFSSDAIPVHLLTREALELYLSRLSPGGVMAFHISNRHLALGPVLAGVSRSIGLTAIEQVHAVTASEGSAGQSTSDWVLVSRRPADLEPLNSSGNWTTLIGPSAPLPWTDDFSNILTALKFR
jgi:spermidine synthase